MHNLKMTIHDITLKQLLAIQGTKAKVLAGFKLFLDQFSPENRTIMRI